MSTVKELRAAAKALSISGYSRMNKAELEQVISDIENAPIMDIPAPAETATQPAPANGKFAVGQTYRVNTWARYYRTWEVKNRTAKYVTFVDGVWVVRCKVREDETGREHAWVELNGRGNLLDALVEEAPAPAATSESETVAPATEVEPAPAPAKLVSCRYDFSACKDEKKLRSVLNAAKVEQLVVIAHGVKGFKPRSDGKRMSKKFYVDAIVRLYFPQEREKPAPAKQARPEFQGEQFVEGKIYVQTIWGESKLYKVIQRKKNRITFVEVNPHDLTEYISAPEDRTVKHIGTITEYITPSHRYHGDLLATREYSRVFMETPNTPGCDMDFDETAYSPDYQANPAVLENVPEGRGTEIAAAPAPVVVLEQPALAQPVPAPVKEQAATATYKPSRRTHRRHDDIRTILIDFGDETPETPITDTTPDIPCTCRRTTRRRASVKIDYSRQLILLFGDEPETFGGHDDQRKAA